ncbi:MAG TPA: glycosyltransferase 87 family protein [Candidatus Elarobacter sp.]
MVRLLKAGLLVAVVVALVAVPYTRRHLFGVNDLGGFAAFYCGGTVARQGHDPYHAEPLRACEQTLPSYRYDVAGVVEPAPFPPVVLAAFGALSLLPFAWAFGAYAALALIAIAFATWALQRLTGFSPWFVGASLAVGALYQNLHFGEIPPLVIGIVCAVALLLERGRPRAAALVASLALIEPHVAAPVLLALFLVSKPSRATLAIAGIVVAIVSVVVLHPLLTAEYFLSALPAHAASEVTANDQYSVTWIAHMLRVPDSWALRAGSLSYAATAALGVLAGKRLATRLGRPSLAVLVPAAFAVTGGLFIHDLQLPIALPAALVLASVTAGRVRALALTAAMLLAVTWFGDFSAVLALAALAVMAWTAPLAFAQPSRRAVFAASVCAGYACAVLAFHALSPHAHVALPVHPNAGGAPDELASAVWGRFVRMTPYGWASPRTLAEKVPLFVALALLAYAVVSAARPNGALRREPSAPPSR